MGVGPPLPAPTDPSSLSSATTTDQATDVSRRTDRTSYSIPEDGSPITISTRRKRQDRERDKESKLTRSSHHSQTSLLIEYFEGGKSRSSVQARPSVRVKVTPSAARKIKDTNEHIQITETGRARQPSYSRRVLLSQNAHGDTHVVDAADDQSQSSFASATEETRRPPIEVEVMGHRDDSPLTATSSPRDSRYVRPNPSEISSMPPDSLLESRNTNRAVRRTRSRSLEREKIGTAPDTLKTPQRRRSRSLSRDRSRERITQMAVEKLRSKPMDSSAKHKRSSKSRSRSVSKEHVETVKSSSGRRRSSRTHHEDDPVSGVESSLLTNSQLSTTHKSGDQYSFRSGTSKSSINNPRLLETVEDAIRRLILPELTALKREQKTSRNRSRFDESTRDSTASGGTTISGERRLSKTSSAPDVKPKVVLNRDEQSPGIVLSGDSVKRRKTRRSSRGLVESPSERSYGREVGEGRLTEGESKVKRSKERPGMKDAVVAGTAGALTTAALKHHDSKSSVDQKERRKRRSKSRSRSASASLAEDMEYAINEDIPPMPLSSAINGSELTRTSILTERTERPLSASQERHIAAAQSPRAMQQGLGLHHSNASRGDLTTHSPKSSHSLQSGGFVARAVQAGLAAAATAGTVTIDDNFEHDHALHHPRSLSPIQSSVGYKDESVVETENRESFLQTRSAESLPSLDRRFARKKSTLSIDSVSSAPSSEVAKSRRLQGARDERNSGSSNGTVRHTRDLGEHGKPRDGDHEYWRDDEFETPQGHGRVGLKEPQIHIKHLTNYTDDSIDGTYLDKMTAGQQILAVGQNPEFRHTPVAVSSAVASLHNPSVIDVHSTRSGLSKTGHESYPNSINENYTEQERTSTNLQVSPMRRKPVPSKDGASSGSHKSLPNGSENAYLEANHLRVPDEHEEHITLSASSLPVAGDPLPEIVNGLEDESDINTNPSIIQGPIGGIPQGNLDHWPYDPTPLLDGHSTPSIREDLNTAAGLLGNAAGAGLGVIAADTKEDLVQEYERTKDLPASYGIDSPNKDGYTDGVNHDFGTRMDSMYQAEELVQATPMKDEGYISAANPRSPALISPEPKRAGLNGYEDEFDGLNDGLGDDDPFVSSRDAHARHLSGYSHGMPSPLYDSATGRGIDRIQSKDIVALMEHLTVRDAQRNARDTEILVTLVRSAAEMRNSFEDMKRFLAEQESNIINTTDKNTERSVQKVINGPRPIPLGTPRSARRGFTDDEMAEDIPTKRRNVFRRALKGLSMRSSNDLAKIEDMLVQLLGDVEGLKAAQEPRTSVTQPTTSLNSYDNLRTVREGYEPEGQAGTGSTNQSGSGFFSNPPSRQASAMRGFDNGRVNEHRISTVLEGDEELAAHEEDLGAEHAKNEQLLVPGERQTRGSSVPLDSPHQIPIPAAPHSSENTPKTDKSRKHKSNSSSIFPRISRWSETTASTVAKQFRGSGRKDRGYSDAASRSGSQVDVWDYNQQGLQDDDRLRSSYSLESTPSRREDRPRSPLIPHDADSTVQHNDVKYQAHRDSGNLQHPQPRQGPTHRYQYQLETQAQNFDSPISTSSEQWTTSNPNLARFSGGSAGAANRYTAGGVGGHLSPISDRGSYSHVGSSTTATAREREGAPARPPKILDDEPLVPSRPPKVSSASNKDNENRYSNGSGPSHMNGSPRSASGRGLQRKPTGPRPISSNNTYAV
ncbi:MAG: hypothetical protein M1816_006916 [Peltula sp. TS41687]|nr:MAG: hypothetical protein M1816_006916 [Peltula sp. TS41687]